jgi:hypothetical protein
MYGPDDAPGLSDGPLIECRDRRVENPWGEGVTGSVAGTSW